jgi:hypothetical protein
MAYEAERLPNGNLLIPSRAEGPGAIGDGKREITPADPEYADWLPFVKGEQNPPGIVPPPQ